MHPHEGRDRMRMAWSAHTRSEWHGTHMRPHVPPAQDETSMAMRRKSAHTRQAAAQHARAHSGEALTLALTRIDHMHELRGSPHVLQEEPVKGGASRMLPSAPQPHPTPTQTHTQRREARGGDAGRPTCSERTQEGGLEGCPAPNSP